LAGQPKSEHRRISKSNETSYAGQSEITEEELEELEELKDGLL